MYRYFKRLFDFILAVILIVIFSPIIICICLIIKLTTKGDIFFIQERIGFNEKRFRIIKFTSMIPVNKSVENSLSDANRITIAGKILRKYSLDEIPQIFNVLKGEMSFVGPRPLLVEYLTLYNSEQKQRHKVKPGITGWAQINGRNSIDWYEKFELDIWYVNNYNFLTDFKIIFLTIKKIIISEGINKSNEITMEKFRGN